jgi:predicted enzyme related to lactoylglutathione lyase
MAAAGKRLSQFPSSKGVRMPVGPIVEVILYVSDMERAVCFYRDFLGLTPISPQCQDYGHEFWVILNTGGCKLCLHGGGKDDRGSDAPKIVFHVDDIHAWRSALIAKGLPVEPIFSPTSGILVCNSADPDGNRFSLESSAVTCED